VPWLAEYFHDMSVFPKGKHDDQIDPIVHFLDWFKTPMPHWSMNSPADRPQNSSSASRRGARSLPGSRAKTPSQTTIGS
jgi:hypothetical protein